ncbi:hypothetical protein K466DRAFT_504583, partial [Polyporus arcularius HHB13444]
KIAEWLPMREEFLEELLRYYGGEYAVETGEVPCAACEKPGATLRCTACATRRVFCQSCIEASHNRLPLHALEQWDGKKWVKRSLRDLGVVFQLGHDGAQCPCSAETTHRLVIGDVTGIHQVQVRFCECLDESEQFTYKWVQLFRQGWFPATTHRPATAFTFRMLNAFQELNLQGKTNLYDYWRSLERITDNSGSGPPLASHVVRLWRHLTALKRGARCHDPTGAAGTREGELALDCPACPHPGKNLPEDWQSAPPEIRWIYTLFLMLDANFRAKLKDRGLEDAELGPGWSYYVENSKFQAHSLADSCRTQKSTCSAEHKAIQNANLRKDGYIASGVGAVLCARHAVVRKNAAGDLPNGEKYVCTIRYLIMDYLLFSTLLGVILMLLISYDIACQWHKKLARRAREDLPPHIRREITEMQIRFAIPKKHIRVHGPKHSQFSLNFLRWVGRTYAEGIEAHWAHMNPVALSAREMSPGMRREHMDDHWGGWNWQKIIGFGTYLLQLMMEADKMYAKQATAHKNLSATFPTENVERWNAEINAWHEDPRGAEVDPYEEQHATATIKSTRLAIAEEEAQELAAGTLPPHEVSPGVFLQLGLEIEEQHSQCNCVSRRGLQVREKNSSGTDGSLAEIQEKRTTLKRRIDTWQALQDLHMPIVPQFRHSGDPAALTAIIEAAAVRPAPPPPPPPTSNTKVKAEDISLWLPSALPPRLRATLGPGLVNKERRLRIAQADDALEDIRRLRRILTGIADFKRLNINGTGQRTIGKARTLFTKFQEKVRRAAARYRAVRAALESLDKGGDWEVRLKVLHDADIRGPGRDSDEYTSEGRYEVSWIWLVGRGADGTLPGGVEGELDPGEILENIKVEWARSQARAERWGEEVILLEEEMRRVIEYFEWKATWWREQRSRRSRLPAALQRGLGAYAEYQAAVFEGLASRCTDLWVPYLRKRSRALPAWTARYPTAGEKTKTSLGRSRVGAMPSAARVGTSASTATAQEALESSGSDSSDTGSSDEESD